MGWIAFEISVNLFQATMIVYFMRKRLSTVRGSILTDLLCIGLIALLSSLYLFYEIPATDTLIFVAPLIYGWYISKNRWYEVLFWITILALIFIGSANLTSTFYRSVMKASWDQLTAQSSLRVGMVLSANLITLISISTLTRIKKRNAEVPLYCFGLLLLLNLLCLLSIEMLFSLGLSGVTDMWFNAMCICQFLIAILSVVIYEIIVRSTYKHQQYVLEHERLQLTTKYNQEIESVYADIQVFRHDIKQQVQVVSQVMETVDSGEFNQYLLNLHDRLGTMLPYSTGNIAVDALLTTKASMMRKNGITLCFQNYPIPSLPISDGDFCILLGNLLDNATEGVARLGESTRNTVMLSFARSWDMLYIVCNNPYDPKTVRRTVGGFLSSKTESRYGVGTWSMDHIVHVANGDIEYTLNDNDFHVRILLPYEAKG